MVWGREETGDGMWAGYWRVAAWCVGGLLGDMGRLLEVLAWVSSACGVRNKGMVWCCMLFSSLQSRQACMGGKPCTWGEDSMGCR